MKRLLLEGSSMSNIATAPPTEQVTGACISSGGKPDFDRELHTAMRYLGLLIPHSWEEVQRIEELERTNPEPPPPIPDPAVLWREVLRRQGLAPDNDQESRKIGLKSLAWVDLDQSILECCFHQPSYRCKVHSRLMTEYGLRLSYDDTCAAIDDLVAKGRLEEEVTFRLNRQRYRRYRTVRPGVQESLTQTELELELELRVIDCCSAGPESHRRIYHRIQVEYGILEPPDVVYTVIGNLVKRGWLSAAASRHNGDKSQRFVVTIDGTVERYLLSASVPVGSGSLISDSSIDPNIGS